MNGKIYGYARVSTREQNEARQIKALLGFGVEQKNIVVEKQSGKDFARPLYQKLIRKLKAEDTLVVTSLDRLGRNYFQILDQWRKITKTIQAAVVVLDMPLLDTRRGKDLTGILIADIVLQLLSYVPRPSGKTPANASGKGFLPPNPGASTSALSGWNCRKIFPLWPICGVKEAFPPARPPSPWAFPTRPSSAGPKSGNRPNKQAFRKSGKSHFFEFCKGLHARLRRTLAP